MKEQVCSILKRIRPDIDLECDNFVDNGYLDSFDISVIVATLDDTFAIAILGSDILPENFKNVNSIVNMIIRYKEQ